MVIQNDLTEDRRVDGNLAATSPILGMFKSGKNGLFPDLNIQ